MSLTYEIITKRIDTSKVGKQILEVIEKYKESYKKTPKKADAVFGRPLLRKLKQQKPEAFMTRSNPRAIQKAGQDLRVDKSSKAGEVLAKARWRDEEKATKQNAQIAAYRLRIKNFGKLTPKRISGYGSNDVML